MTREQRLEAALRKAMEKSVCFCSDPNHYSHCWKTEARQALATPAGNSEGKPEGDWQPIEQCPDEWKDGRRMMLWVEHENLKYCEPKDRYLWEGPVFGSWSDHNQGGWTYYGLFGTVTHVQPLPQPPAQEVGS